jgi:hypothetical protein
MATVKVAQLNRGRIRSRLKPLPTVHIRKPPDLLGSVSFTLAWTGGGGPLRCIL